MEGSALRMCGARGGLSLVPRGDFCPRPADNGGVLRFVVASSGATRRPIMSSSSVSSAWWPLQAAPVATTTRPGCHRHDPWSSSSTAKNLQQLQRGLAPAAQDGRRPLPVFCSPGNNSSSNGRPRLERADSFATAKYKLQAALGAPGTIDGEEILRSLSTLTRFAGDSGYYENEYMANQLLDAAVIVPLKNDLHKHATLHGVVKKSLELASSLLKNAPEPIGEKLRNKLEPTLQRIIGDQESGEDLRELAANILNLQELP